MCLNSLAVLNAPFGFCATRRGNAATLCFILKAQNGFLLRDSLHLFATYRCGILCPFRVCEKCPRKVPGFFFSAGSSAVSGCSVKITIMYLEQGDFSKCCQTGFDFVSCFG